MRVIDLTDGVAAVAGRLLADMGADVVLVEPPEGVASRRANPRHHGHGLRFATEHFNKRGIVLDLRSAEQRDTLLRLTDAADLVLESRPVGELDALGVGPRIMRQRNPGLVVVSITGFGQTGPYRGYRATEPVLLAMSSVLTRSGAPHREPLLPPGELGGQTAAIHCAFAALLADYRARRTGHGDYVDCSLLDLAVQDLDPGFGMGGSASGGRRLSEQPPGRPDLRFLYPIIACADGHVRMFIGSAKQWRALVGWMGNPPEFSDPALDQMGIRHRNWAIIRPGIEKLFADKTRDEIVARGAELGIAVAALHTAADSGGGWAFAEIRNALAAARSRQRSIAEAMGELGEALEISELIDLSASIALTDSQGARIRSSLVAKADSLRAQQVAETKAEADSATEHMTLPVALLLLGFICFLGYPAVAAISNVGGG